MRAQQLDIKPVFVVAEDRLAPIATLGDVVRHVRADCAGELGHGAIMAEAGTGLKSVVDQKFPEFSDNFYLELKIV